MALKVNHTKSATFSVSDSFRQYTYAYVVHRCIMHTNTRTTNHKPRPPNFFKLPPGYLVECTVSPDWQGFSMAGNGCGWIWVCGLLRALSLCVLSWKISRTPVDFGPFQHGQRIGALAIPASLLGYLSVVSCAPRFPVEYLNSQIPSSMPGPTAWVVVNHPAGTTTWPPSPDFNYYCFPIDIKGHPSPAPRLGITEDSITFNHPTHRADNSFQGSPPGPNTGRAVKDEAIIYTIDKH
jgi:hypothetical protein